MAEPIDIHAPMQGTIVHLDVVLGQQVRAGQQLALIESMKMHHAIESTTDGTVTAVAVAVGQTVGVGAVVAAVEPGVVAVAAATAARDEDPAHIRPDLAEAVARHAIGLDDARPDAVAKRRAVHRRTARENVADLVDPGSFKVAKSGVARDALARRTDELVDVELRAATPQHRQVRSTTDPTRSHCHRAPDHRRTLEWADRWRSAA